MELEKDGIWRVAGYLHPMIDMTCSRPEVQRKIDREIAKYPPDQKQSAVMSALAFAQDEHGWLSTDVMDAVAQLPRACRRWPSTRSRRSTRCTT